MEDETVSQAAKGALAARHQGWLPHRSPTATRRAGGRHALLFATVLLVQRDKQANTQQAVLRLENLLEGVTTRPTTTPTPTTISRLSRPWSSLRVGDSPPVSGCVVRKAGTRLLRVPLS